MSKAFLVDAVSGRIFAYEELIDELNAPEQAVPAYVYTSDTFTVFKAYLQALLFDEKLILLDHDFSADEIAKLVPEEGVIAEVRYHSLEKPIQDVDDLVQRLQSSTGAEIGFFTSGTTGLPKQVNHRLMGLARSVKTGDAHANDIWAFAYNSTHIAGCQVFLQAVLNGNTLVNVFGLGQNEIYAALNEHVVTHISATPTFYRMMLPTGVEVPSVRRVTFGGERLDSGLEQQLKPMFPNARFLNVYATTEAGTILAAHGDEFSVKEGLEGMVKIEDAQIHVHRDLLGSFSGRTVAGDWYATGDMVEIVSTDPLRFRILHRDNDLINVGGYKVNPAEVEATLRSIDGVNDARVYGQANSVLGNIVCCEVVPSGTNTSEKEIRQVLSQTLQPYKIPRIFTFVENLEQTRTGKLKRT